MAKKRTSRTQKQTHSFSIGQLAQLPKDPQMSIDRIEELARRVLSGDILLPKFQRRFVWERQQVLALLESISRGYPIGSILLWQSSDEIHVRREVV